MHQFLVWYFKIPGVPTDEQVREVKLWILVYLRRGTLQIWAPRAMIAWRYLSELTEESVTDLKRFDPLGPDMWIDFACGPYEITAPFARGLAIRNIGWVRNKTGKNFIIHKDKFRIKSQLGLSAAR